MSDNTSAAVMRPRPAAAVAALIGILVLTAGCWIISVRQMTGMDMGVATRLGSLAFFAALWVPMMAAMMLPGATMAVARRAQVAGGLRVAPVFVVSYLAVWALVGIAVYFVYRPHGAVAAGALVIAAGSYELTPMKRACRRRCRESRSGLEFGLCCVGSSIGLMVILLALGLMSIAWMAVITVVVLAQKLLPARAAIDLPIALAIAGLGILIIIAPSSIAGLTPSM
jgi:predicted metal-binding membrane protein